MKDDKLDTYTPLADVLKLLAGDKNVSKEFREIMKPEEEKEEQRESTRGSGL
jgi:hypothetical protein